MNHFILLQFQVRILKTETLHSLGKWRPLFQILLVYSPADQKPEYFGCEICLAKNPSVVISSTEYSNGARTEFYSTECVTGAILACHVLGLHLSAFSLLVVVLFVYFFYCSFTSYLFNSFNRIHKIPFETQVVCIITARGTSPVSSFFPTVGFWFLCVTNGV